MYSPIQDGIDKSVRSVQYLEAQPSRSLAGLIHCFWELKTITDLLDDFHYHALPDACANILFNQVETDIAGVTALRTKAEVLNLGRSFHYVGIQLYPGVWQGKQEKLFDSYVGTPYLGSLPLIQVSENIKDLNFNSKLPALSDLVEWLLKEEFIKYNVLTARILENLDRIHTVADMAIITELSPRQLQRSLKQTTGFSPHDFLKVLRVQQSFGRHYLELYADQSHYIHSFRKVTGYTPAKYTAKFKKEARDKYGKIFPVEWRVESGENKGAEVNIDDPILVPVGQEPKDPHVGYQTAGKRGSGGAVRGHIMLDKVPVSRGRIGQ